MGKPRVRVGEVVVPDGLQRDIELMCESCGIAWTPEHADAIGISGTVVVTDGKVAVLRMHSKAALSWPARCLVVSSALPPHLHNRSLLSQIKQRRGQALKTLQEELLSRPPLMARYMRRRQVDEENERTRVQMMWAVDAKSKVRHVANRATHLFTYTDPIGTGTVPKYVRPPDDAVVEKFTVAWAENRKRTVKPQVPNPPVQTLPQVPSLRLTMTACT